MKVSKRTEYGLRAIVALAEQTTVTREPVPLRQIAEQEDIPEAFLDQIFSALRKDGIVQSVRGAGGGFILAHDPSQITMGRVVRLLEGGLSPIGCVGEDMDSSEDFCHKAAHCHTRSVWLKLYNSIEKALDGIRLSDVMETDQHAAVESM